MTTTNEQGAAVEKREDLVTCTIDGFEVSVPKGTLIIRAAEQIGIQIPRFCDHPLLDPVGACRQCIVDVEGQRKPLTACTTTVAPDMVIKTQLTSPVAEKAQRGQMEFLLINHPLDCPICDKGGECPLQNQAMSNGQAETRFYDVKRTYVKPIAISSQVLLDRERCVLCARCTRFSAQIAGDPFITLMERGALQQVGAYADEPFESYFSGNTIQICPVGALTGAQYRFRSRPFDLVSTPGICEHCASGCSQRTDWRRGRVMRRLAGEDPAVNEEWNCDKGRWAFQYAFLPDRISTPLLRDDNGELREASWTEALEYAADRLVMARDNRGVGVLPGGRLTLEDAYGYAKFARVALHTNDIDMRARPHSAEETAFLSSYVAGSGLGVTYGDLDQAPAVLLVGFEPEEESPIVFLRLRKAARRQLRVFSIAPFTSASVRKTFGTLLRAAPGTEAEYLDALRAGVSDPRLDESARAAAAAIRDTGAIVLVGERLATVPGALTAAARLAEATGARLAWIPRRAGERGAVEAGCLPSLLPGGRAAGLAEASDPVSALWNVALPHRAGRDATGILTAARDGELDALVVGGVDPLDFADARLAIDALTEVPFVVSLEIRRSAVTDIANVVFPVAPVVHKSGAFVDWEGRLRPFPETLRSTGAMSDYRVLDRLADEMGAPLELRDIGHVRREYDGLARVRSTRPQFSGAANVEAPMPAGGQAVLATWPMLLDNGRMQDGDPYLAGTARQPRALLSAATAREIGAAEGDGVTVSTGLGAITLPLAIADLPDRVVWVPTNSGPATVRYDLGAVAGALVSIAAAGPLEPAPAVSAISGGAE